MSSSLYHSTYIEDDTDYIDDYITSNIVEDLYNVDIKDDKP